MDIEPATPRLSLEESLDHGLKAPAYQGETQTSTLTNKKGTIFVSNL